MSLQKNEKSYDTWSNFYDTYPNPTVAVDDLVFPKFYSSEKNKNILEIGCGTGRHTKRILDAGNKVTGVDISPGMLEKAKEKLGSTNLTLIQGDFVSSRIFGGPFDAVVMSLVLEHIDNLHHFFSKVRHLLVPNALFYFSEIHPLA